MSDSLPFSAMPIDHLVNTARLCAAIPEYRHVAEQIVDYIVSMDATDFPEDSYYWAWAFRDIGQDYDAKNVQALLDILIETLKEKR